MCRTSMRFENIHKIHKRCVNQGDEVLMVEELAGRVVLLQQTDVWPKLLCEQIPPEPASFYDTMQNFQLFLQ